MSDNTKIQWSDATWNPVRGCTKVSPGCAHCYAETFAERWRGVPGHPFEQGFDLRLVPEALAKPLHWKKPRRIFVNSMSDLFHEDVPDEFIDKVFSVMALCPQHVFQVLTKRTERMARYILCRSKSSKFWEDACPSGYALRWEHEGKSYPLCPFPLPNVWLGVSVEDQKRADERIGHLCGTPSAIRFLSCEPLLGPIDMSFLKDLCREPSGEVHMRCEKPERKKYGPPIDWVIVGGESGPGARPCQLEWIESIRNQCKAAGVPCFVKQLGAKAMDRAYRYPLKDSKGGEINEWPEDLRVREFPGLVKCLKS